MPDIVLRTSVGQSLLRHVELEELVEGIRLAHWGCVSPMSLRTMRTSFLDESLGLMIVVEELAEIGARKDQGLLRNVLRLLFWLPCNKVFMLGVVLGFCLFVVEAKAGKRNTMRQMVVHAFFLIVAILQFVICTATFRAMLLLVAMLNNVTIYVTVVAPWERLVVRSFVKDETT